MEYLEKTEIAGNVINSKTNQQEKIMEDQVQNQQVEIKINLSLEQVIEGLKTSGKLTNFVVSSDDFETKVDEIAGRAAETTFEEKADDWISDYISSNSSDVADQLTDSIETIFDNRIDYDDIAGEVSDRIDVEDKIDEWVNSQLRSFSAGSNCDIAKEAARVVIDTIRYDLATHLRSEQGAVSVYSKTITDSLTKFIDERIEVRFNEEKEQYLKNKQGYMQETADKLNQPSITVEQFIQFINGLELYQVAKDKIIEEFKKIIPNSNN